MKKILIILLFLASTSFLKSQNIMSNQAVFENFILQINDHNVDGIIALISDDHVFTDAQGIHFEGKDNLRAGWTAYFKMFPDYKITILNSMENATVFLASGTAEGTYGGVKNQAGDNYWNIPAAWRAEIDNAKVKSWQIYADTKMPEIIINKYSSKTSSENSTDDLKVQGFGGVFLKSKDPKALGEWYNKNLGTSFGKESYMMFEWSERGNASSKASTTFGIFGEKTKYFDPSTKEMMLNFRVKDLHKLLNKLKADGVTLVGTPEDYDYGKFGWIMDIDGNKIELWEPIDKVLDDYEQEKKK